MTLPEISLWVIKFSKSSLFTERICILRFHLVNFLCWANIFSPGHPSNSSLLKLKIYKPKQSSLFVDLSSVSPCLASLDVAVFDVSWRRQASTFPSNIEPLTWSPDPLDCPAIANPWVRGRRKRLILKREDICTQAWLKNLPLTPLHYALTLPGEKVANSVTYNTPGFPLFIKRALGLGCQLAFWYYLRLYLRAGLKDE